jgi:hypothetical protein
MAFLEKQKFKIKRYVLSGFRESQQEKNFEWGFMFSWSVVKAGGFV